MRLMTGVGEWDIETSRERSVDELLIITVCQGLYQGHHQEKVPARGQVQNRGLVFGQQGSFLQIKLVKRD